MAIYVNGVEDKVTCNRPVALNLVIMIQKIQANVVRTGVCMEVVDQETLVKIGSRQNPEKTTVVEVDI